MSVDATHTQQYTHRHPGAPDIVDFILESPADMDDHATTIIAAVLTGGAARRMGRSKHDLRLDDGRTMLEVLVDACRPVADRVVVCGPPDLLPDLPHIEDRMPGQGPMGALDALLASGLADRYLVVPCDMPALEPQDLHRLATADADIAIFDHEGDGPLRSLPMLITASRADVVADRLASTDRSLHGMLEAEPVVRIEPPPTERLLNVNGPDDWEAFRASRLDD